MREFVVNKLPGGGVLNPAVALRVVVMGALSTCHEKFPKEVVPDPVVEVT